MSIEFERRSALDIINLNSYFEVVLSTDSTVVCFQYDIVGHLSVNVEMPAAGSDSPCLAVEEVWRTSLTFLFMEQAFELDLLQKLHFFRLKNLNRE